MSRGDLDYRADNRPPRDYEFPRPRRTRTVGKGYRMVTVDIGGVVHIYEEREGACYYDRADCDGWRDEIEQHEFDTQWEGK